MYLLFTKPRCEFTWGPNGKHYGTLSETAADTPVAHIRVPGLVLALPFLIQLLTNTRTEVTATLMENPYRSPVCWIHLGWHSYFWHLGGKKKPWLISPPSGCVGYSIFSNKWALKSVIKCLHGELLNVFGMY